MRFALSFFAVTLLAATPVGGQTPTTGSAPARPATATAPVNPVPPLEPQGYDYDPAGRRDPFISLVRRTAATPFGTSANSRPTGIGGLAIDEIVVRGLLEGSSGRKAMVKGVDNRSYTLAAGDALFDGTVKAVTAEGLILLQNVNDPLSTVRKREVKKLLRPTQEAQ